MSAIVSCSISLRCIRRSYLLACMPPVLQKHEEESSTGQCGRRHEYNPELFVTTSAGEDETSEANPLNRNGDAFDVAPRYQAAAKLAAAEPATRGPVVQELYMPARQPDGSRSLSAGLMAKRTGICNSSSRSMPPNRTVFYQQREWQHAHFLGKTLCIWKWNANGSASHHR